MCLAQGPQRSDAGEARIHGPSFLSQALYHWATALPFGNELDYESHSDRQSENLMSVDNDSVILIRYDEDFVNCTDVEAFQQNEITLTFKRKVKFVTGNQIIKKNMVVLSTEKSSNFNTYRQKLNKIIHSYNILLWGSVMTHDV